MRERPDRAVVADAIEASGGNLSRAAAALGCSRTTLYDWIWRYGLQRMAGLDTRECQDGRGTFVSVQSGASPVPTLGSNMSAESVAAVETDLERNHNVKVRDSVWTAVQHAAIDRRISISRAVEEALAMWLEGRQ